MPTHELILFSDFPQSAESAVPNTRFWCFVKAFRVIINVDNIKIGDITDDEAALADMDMMLDCLTLYLT